MQELEALGNASVIPIVIFLTQLIKTKLGNIKYKADVVAFGLSMLLCAGWTLYNMTPFQFEMWVQGDSLYKFKFVIDQVVVGFGTWLAASKIYDMGHGNKKRGKAVSAQLELQLTEKVELQKEIVKLKTNGGTDEQIEEDPIMAGRLREILGG